MDRFVRAGGAAAAYTEAQIAELEVPAAPYFTSGDPDNDIAPTEPGGMWYAMLTEEARNVVVEAGLEPNVRNWNQLAQAIQIITERESIAINGVPAAPGSVVSDSETNVLELSWTAPTGGAKVAYYVIEYVVSSTNKPPVQIAGSATSARIHIDATLGPNIVSGNIYAVSLTGARSVGSAFSQNVAYAASAGAFDTPDTVNVGRYSGRLSIDWDYTANQPDNTSLQFVVKDSDDNDVYQGSSETGPVDIFGLDNGEAYSIEGVVLGHTNGRSTEVTVAGTHTLAIGSEIISETFNTADTSPIGATAETHVGKTYTGVQSRYAVTDAAGSLLFKGLSVLGFVWDGNLRLFRLIIDGRYEFSVERVEGFYLTINDGADTVTLQFSNGNVVSAASESYIEWDVIEAPFAAVGSSSTVKVING